VQQVIREPILSEVILMLARKIKRIADRIYRGIAADSQLDNRAEEMLPPDWMFADPDRVDGSHNLKEFISIGDDTANWFIEALGLAANYRVLDVGCGIGRIARPLARHLTDGGTYDGIEIAPYKIKYCRDTIGSRFSNFKFHHADVYNKYYNPDGRSQAREYNFPFADNSFDFVYLVSVFTHMLPEDMEHYVSEIARVLKPEAKCSASFWLTAAQIGTPYHQYSEVCEIYRVEEPEHGVIYVEDYVKGLYARYGLRIAHLYHGCWIQRADSSQAHKQDIVIAEKDTDTV
jgi:SAM-dependent methyltransferase